MLHPILLDASILSGREINLITQLCSLSYDYLSTVNKTCQEVPTLGVHPYRLYQVENT